MVAGQRGTAMPPARNSVMSSQVAANSRTNATDSNTIRWLDQTTATATTMSAAPLRTRVMGGKETCSRPRRS